jgi:beta-phosphoglucomutase
VNGRVDGCLPPLELVIFDAEGVIVDTEGAWDLAQRDLLARRGHVYDRETIKPLLTGRSGAEGARILVEHFQLDDDPGAVETERRELVRQHLVEDVRFIPGFERFHAAVGTRYRTCVATAMDLDLLESVDRRLGLTERFGGHLFRLDRPELRAKPYPDLFLHAAASMGVAPARCLVIEDAPLGIEAAQRAGMRTVGLATTYRPDALRAADRVVTSYAELDPVTLADLGAAEV